MNTSVQNKPKNPYQNQPKPDKPKAPIWADKQSFSESKFGEKYEVPEETKQSMAFDSTQASKDYNASWNTWLQPRAEVRKAEPNQIEFKAQPAKPDLSTNGWHNVEEKVQSETPAVATPYEIKQSVHDSEIKTVLLAADVLDNLQKFNEVDRETGFASRGEIKFNSENENTQKVFTESLEIKPEDPAERYLLERSDQPQEFGTQTKDINVRQPERLVDFGYFFTWMFGGLREPLGSIFQPVKGFFKSLFGSMNILGKKEVFFKNKPLLTPEKQEAETKQNQNKASFFATLRANTGMFLGLDRKRNMKQQLEQTNRQAGFSNVSYEGDADLSGQIRENVLMDAEKGNSQKTAEQLNQEKQRKLSFMSKGKAKSGPGISFSADKSHNFNNAAKLAG